MPRRATLTIVATAAGVSKSTASLALAGDRRVQLQTRERVCAAAKAVGYVRDPLLSALASDRFRADRRRPLVAVIMRGQANFDIMAEVAEAQGFAVHDMRGTAAEAYASRCRDLGVCGQIIATRSPALQAALPSDLPTVSWMHEGDPPSWQHVVDEIDWFAAARGAAGRMRATGLRRLGAVFLPSRPAHWADAVRAGAAMVEGLPVMSQWRPTAVMLQDWVRRHRLDGILLQASHQYESIRRALPLMPCAAMCIYSEGNGTAGYRPDRELRCRVSLDLIESSLRHGISPGLRITVPSRWCDGPSLNPVQRVR